MATKQKAEQHAAGDDREDRRRNAVIGEYVLHALGEPSNLQKVEVRRLWECHYRANVFVSMGTGSARVAHSYFLVADGDGNVIESTPTISRQY